MSKKRAAVDDDEEVWKASPPTIRSHHHGTFRLCCMHKTKKGGNVKGTLVFASGYVTQEDAQKDAALFRYAVHLDGADDWTTTDKGSKYLAGFERFKSPSRSMFDSNLSAPNASQLAKIRRINPEVTREKLKEVLKKGEEDPGVMARFMRGLERSRLDKSLTPQSVTDKLDYLLRQRRPLLMKMIAQKKKYTTTLRKAIADNKIAGIIIIGYSKRYFRKHNTCETKDLELQVRRSLAPDIITLPRLWKFERRTWLYQQMYVSLSRTHDNNTTLSFELLESTMSAKKLTHRNILEIERDFLAVA
jgi:hypothetical protein